MGSDFRTMAVKKWPAGKKRASYRKSPHGETCLGMQEAALALH